MVKRRMSEFDLDSDGQVTEAELERSSRIIDIENKDAKGDAQRKMAWYALSGLVFYPLLIVFATFFDMPEASKILGETAGAYFLAVAGIVAAFFGKEAYLGKSR